MGVDLGAFQRGVAQEARDAVQGHTGFEQVRGDGVAERVQPDLLVLQLRIAAALLQLFQAQKFISAVLDVLRIINTFRK